MTTKIILLLCWVLGACVIPVSSKEPSESDKTPDIGAITRHLDQIDLEVALQHYREIRAEFAKTDLRLALLEVEMVGDQNRKLEFHRLEKRKNILAEQAKALRQTIQNRVSAMKERNKNPPSE